MNVITTGRLDSQPGGGLAHQQAPGPGQLESRNDPRTTQFIERWLIAMAGLTFTTTSQMANFGRSGYNKDGDNEDDKRNFGRSGYNKDDSDDDKKSFGRSGYNKDGDDEDGRCFLNFGRSGYN
ncbi:hypothetical protein F5Y06DRAFT_300411 [Hypoxylon sp. FL0890]|nr:hypothetical protein F5Y06DRAFT_300411 [Hypoxylon sp. FL0890]